MNPSLTNLIKVLVIVLLVGMVYSFVLDNNGYLRQRELTQEIQNKQLIVDSLSRRAQTLRDSIHLLQYDSTTLIRLARARFGMSKPGEKLFKFSPSEDSIRPDTVKAN